jgi:hypothetical protein
VRELDTAFWLDASCQAKRPAAEVSAILDRWQGEERWIVEGVYGDLAERFLGRTQMLVWLALPWSDCARSLLDRENERRPVRTLENEKSFQALIAYGAEYDVRSNSISRAGHQRPFDAFAGAKFCFTSRTQVDRFLAGLDAPSV